MSLGNKEIFDKCLLRSLRRQLFATRPVARGARLCKRGRWISDSDSAFLFRWCFYSISGSWGRSRFPGAATIQTGCGTSRKGQRLPGLRRGKSHRWMSPGTRRSGGIIIAPSSLIGGLGPIPRPGTAVSQSGPHRRSVCDAWQVAVRRNLKMGGSRLLPS